MRKAAPSRQQTIGSRATYLQDSSGWSDNMSCNPALDGADTSAPYSIDIAGKVRGSESKGSAWRSRSN
jgi:hypothetical protein